MQKFLKGNDKGNSKKEDAFVVYKVFAVAQKQCRCSNKPDGGRSYPPEHGFHMPVVGKPRERIRNDEYQ